MFFLDPYIIRVRTEVRVSLNRLSLRSKDELYKPKDTT